MNDIVVIIAFLITLSFFTATGALAWIYKKKTPSDYLIASRQTPAWLAALSAVSTNNSGFMFIGMIAFTYRMGIESIWMMAGWILGDLAAWFFIHPKVRQKSEETNVNTLSALIGTRSNNGKMSVNRYLVTAAGLVTFIFLGVYAAAQLKAGSTALHALFGWDMSVGVFIGTFIVILYSYAGGIRADIWTDAAQSFVMMATMVLILIVGLYNLGGPVALLDNLRLQDPGLLSIFPEDLAFGIILYLIGMFSAGVGAIGQPHLMTRFLSLESTKSIPKARFWYFAYYIPFFVASIGVGLCTRAIIPELTTLEIAQGLKEPTELALPLVTMRLLPDIFVGISLAGLFAATISTADSQIIVCSGAITHDINPRWQDSYLASKLGTFVITAVALLLALYAPEGVFSLVLIAWSALGAGLGSVLAVRLYKLPLSTATGLSMMFMSTGAVILWHLSKWNDDIFKALPGFIAAFVVYLLFRCIHKISTRSESK